MRCASSIRRQYSSRICEPIPSPRRWASTASGPRCECVSFGSSAPHAPSHLAVRTKERGPHESNEGTALTNWRVVGWQVRGGATPVTPTMVLPSSATRGVCDGATRKSAPKTVSRRRRRDSGSFPNTATGMGLSRKPRASSWTAAGYSSGWRSRTSTVGISSAILTLDTPMAREEVVDHGGARVARERIARDRGSRKEGRAGKHSGATAGVDPARVERIRPVPDSFTWTKCHSFGS